MKYPSVQCEANKSLKRRFLLIALLLINSWVFGLDFKLTNAEQSWIQQNPSVSIAFDGYFPPYSFFNDNNELEGFAVDVFNLIEEITGLDFVVHSEYEWNALYESALNKQVDIVATMVRLTEREGSFIFTDPYIFKTLIINTREDDASIWEKDDIAGKRIALVKGYHYIEAILKQYPSIEPIYVDTILDTLNAVSLGQADASISFIGAIHYLKTKYLLSNLKYAAVYDQNLSNESIAIRKDRPELAAIISKALQSITEQKLQALRARWLPLKEIGSLVEIKYTAAEKAWLRSHPQVRVGVDPEFAPFELMEDNQYLGIAADYLALLGARLKIDFVVQKDLSWGEVIEKTKRGEIDLLPAVGMNESRKDYLNFSSSYLKFHRVIVTRDDFRFISGLGDIKNLRVAVQRDTSHHGFITENTTIEPYLYSTLQESLLAVSGGEVDAFIGNVAVNTFWIRKLNLSNLKIAAPASYEPQNLHIATRKDWPEFASIIEKGLATISAAERNEIARKWLTVEYTPTKDIKLLIQIISLSIALLLAVLLWIYLLRRQVQKKTSELEYSTNYDRLTNLPNRTLMTDRLVQLAKSERGSSEKLAVLSIDIDDFKKVNDALGHDEGDSILTQLASRLQATVEQGDSVGRMGGDQFLILQRHVKDLSDAALLAEAIHNVVKGTFVFGELEIKLTASIGIAIFPDDALDAETLMKKADTAVHHVKKEKHGGYDFFTEQYSESVSRRMMVEHHIQDALAKYEFEVHFQPKFSSIENEVISFEALLRWNNSELGWVSPSEFIPVAERNGLIDAIGFYVLNESLKALKILQQNFNPKLTMAINLSPVQFLNPQLVPEIIDMLVRHQIDSRFVEFEITEGVLLSGYEGISQKIHDLQLTGIKLAMDDFGTGYSSLNYLRQYNFDVIKIDQAFIADLTDQESSQKLVLASIAMAHTMGLEVVAEGVETASQQAILTTLGCDVLQGWLFSKAIPLNDLIDYLKQYYGRAS